MIINLLLFVVMGILVLWVLSIALMPFYIYMRIQDHHAAADIAKALEDEPAPPARPRQHRR